MTFSDQQARERYKQEAGSGYLVPRLTDAVEASIGRALLSLEARIATLEQERDSWKQIATEAGEHHNAMMQERDNWKARADGLYETMKGMEARVKELEQDYERQVTQTAKMTERGIESERQLSAAREHARRLAEALEWARTFATGFTHLSGCPRRANDAHGRCSCGYDAVTFGGVDSTLTAWREASAT